MTVYVLGESVGIELELEDLIPQEILLPDFQRKHDASCESRFNQIGGVKINKPSDLYIDNISSSTFGTELVTMGVINTETPDYFARIKRLTNVINQLGESPRSYRAGFHVHVSCPLNLRISKSIIRLARNQEQVLFLLGTMGYDFRGKKNNSTYCRPITKKGPAIVPGNRGKYYPCMVLDDLLKTKTLAEFQAAYGDLISLLGDAHYIPIRYHMINLVPLWTQGSLEFRVFNKSVNPYYLKAAIEYCKAFTKFAVEASFDSLKEDRLLTENSVFDVTGENDRQKIIDDFRYFSSKTELSNEDGEVILEILSVGDINSIVLPDEYTYTHLMFHMGGSRSPIHWNRQGITYKPKSISEENIVRPIFVDIHNLENNRQEELQAVRRANNEFEVRMRNVMTERNIGNFISSTEQWIASNTTNTGTFVELAESDNEEEEEFFEEEFDQEDE